MPTVTLDGNNVKLGDTYISQGNPGTNYGSNTGLSVGNSGASGTTANRALLKFDLGLIPNDAIINSATLTLTSSNNAGRTVNVHKVTNNWDPTTVVWNSNITFDPAVVASKLINNSSTSYPIDVKTLVQEWVNGVANNGFLIKDSTETGASTAFSFYSHEGGAAGQRPTLTIDYTIPTTGKKQVEYVGNSTAGAGSSVASITVPLPTGTTVGDLLIAEINSSSTGTINLPSGWTMLTTGTSGTTRYAVAYKFVQSGDGGQVFSNTSGPTAWSVAFHLYRNVKQVQTYVGSTYTSPVSSFAPSGFAAQTDNVMMVLINQSPSGTVNFTNPLSTTEALDVAALGAGAIESSYRYLYKSRSLPTSEMSSQVNGTSAGMATAIALEPIANNPPTLTLTNPADNLSLTEGDTYKIEGTISDVDAGNALYLKYSIASGDTQTLSLGVSDGTNPAAFSKVLTYSAGRFWDGSTDVSGLLPAESSSIQIWANDGSDDSTKVTRNFTIQQEDGKLYVPVNVVSQAYLVSQMAPPVRLSNGWLVGAIIDQSTGTIRTYKSTDNGKTWTVFVTNFGGNMTSVATCGDGDYFTVIYATASVTIAMRRYKSDGTLVYNNGILDAAQTAVNSVTLGSAPDGSRIWWAASTKNNAYPNSFNIRAGSIPILADGSLGTPNAVAQASMSNTSGTNNQNPTIIIKSDGKPIILCDYNSGTSSNGIAQFIYNGTAWSTFAYVHYQHGYPQSSPYGITTPNGKLHVAWHGTDASDTVNPYIRYSSSADGTTWLATPRKLVKGQNASITSDKNGKLIITYEDGGYIKRIESTNEFVSYSGPFTVGAGTKPATFYDQSFQTDFSVPPTFFQASGAVKYYGVLNLNKKPVVTLTTPDNQTLTENATLSVAGSTLDGDPGNVVTTWYKINSGPARALQSGISDGSTPLSFARDLRYSGKRMWDGAVDVAGVDLAENTDHTLEVWAEDDKGGKSAGVTRKFRMVWNRPPTISDSNRDLGIMEAPPSVEYSITEPETNPFTVTEKINGQVIRTFSGVAGQQETITIPHELWIRLEPSVPHSLTIEATDNQGMTSTRTYTLTRFVDKIVVSMDFATMQQETKDFFTTDVAAKRLLLTPSWDLPPGAILQVEVCNNAYDEEPSWEDATIVVKLNRAHLFANESKTAEQWGINFRIKIEKGTAIGPIYVKGVGGAFD
ncbi:DNRLRE domain-containing protein [Brevibacillus sp. HD3.3A]|uniref:DNRLRE domain-containing protein n=1 Tax=Brevibacillus sp. HD3.3A TaxID=2738979 RepID=UPI001E4DBE1D|nr:DNRLRE domain-containing protein [Brevibacillus sp. HD3.3A]UED70706.1 DNRLRE domain-containing protein [Brevibacillus sp. HD3.3A]